MYWEREQEALLLALVLESGTRDDWGPTDEILCGLIEMGLVDQDKGPKVFQLWKDGDDTFNAAKAYTELPHGFSLGDD